MGNDYSKGDPTKWTTEELDYVNKVLRRYGVDENVINFAAIKWPEVNPVQMFVARSEPD